MNKRLRPMLGALLLTAILALTSVFIEGCGTVNLAPGGAYSGSTVTTNSSGVVATNQVSAPDPAFFVADAAYKLAYQAVDGPCVIELQNRKALASVFPQLKAALDKIRPTIWDIDQRWARARVIYVANPTPAGLTVLQSILAEAQAIVPAATAAIAPVVTPTSQTTNSVPTT